MPTRDQVFLHTVYDNVGPPVINNDKLQTQDLGRVAYQPAPIASAGPAAQESRAGQQYIPLNPEIWKSYVGNPTNQGQRAAVASRASMMYDPRNSPSRSQMSEGYTPPLQLFSSNNTWNTPTGRTSRGQRQKQPSVKQVSPFANLPIPTRMPWDL